MDRVKQVLGKGPSRAREESNAWLWDHTADVTGTVLSIGSGTDRDGQGKTYREYFRSASKYVTSEVDDSFGSDLLIDVRSMAEIADASYDCVFCSGVLEHVDDYLSSLSEMTRILKPGGILLLGVPFRQPIHSAPLDYWRFTDAGVRHLLKDSFNIDSLTAIDASVEGFPASYWVKATKRTSMPR